MKNNVYKNFFENLSDNETDAILHLADETKADWLVICEYNGNDVIVDLEKEFVFDLEEGLNLIAEYIIEPYDFYGLTNEEIKSIDALFSRFNVIPDFKYHETDD